MKGDVTMTSRTGLQIIIAVIWISYISPGLAEIDKPTDTKNDDITSTSGHPSTSGFITELPLSKRRNDVPTTADQGNDRDVTLSTPSTNKDTTTSSDSDDTSIQYENGPMAMPTTTTPDSAMVTSSASESSTFCPKVCRRCDGAPVPLLPCCEKYNMDWCCKYIIDNYCGECDEEEDEKVVDFCCLRNGTCCGTANEAKLKKEKR